MAILVTGAAGFIGFHVTQKLLDRGNSVIGIDNLNNYYDVSLKQARLENIASRDSKKQFSFKKIDIVDSEQLQSIARDHEVTAIVHLAAQAGVRYSIENPQAYIQSNVVGFMNVLDLSRTSEVEHLVYASSSSVYGNNAKVPFSTIDAVDHPISMYAATKKSNELMAHVYSHLHKIPTTGLRFFTVYGPWGRPDMSPFIFADAIFNNRVIKLFNHGKHQRDFTYVDDIVDGVISVLDKPPGNDEEDSAPYSVYNIGNNQPVELLDYVRALENTIGKQARTELVPLQPGDVVTTYADIDDLRHRFGFEPETPLDIGIGKFVKWYKAYYGYP
ncbi:MAG: NAD-dependent epimerase/dehydratase family protein [bacterium]|nr:NAD-dependent epimerase/dehydratase family protein [Gammaproteobacteria bacterium]HIL94864.1 NAD-dependent epimerase/dehydratase family protein [Pseudomonadales bacterium]